MYGIVMDMTSLSHMVYLSMAALMGMRIIITLLQMFILCLYKYIVTLEEFCGWKLQTLTIILYI